MRTDVALIPGLRSEVEVMRADVALIPDLKTEVVAMRSPVAEIPSISSSLAEIRKDVGELRELRGEVRIIKWMFGALAAALIAGFTIVNQDVGRRVDGVRTELHTATAELRGEIAGLHEAVNGLAERMTRLEVLLRADARAEDARAADPPPVPPERDT